MAGARQIASWLKVFISNTARAPSTHSASPRRSAWLTLAWGSRHFSQSIGVSRVAAARPPACACSCACVPVARVWSMGGRTKGIDRRSRELFQRFELATTSLFGVKKCGRYSTLLTCKRLACVLLPSFLTFQGPRDRRSGVAISPAARSASRAKLWRAGGTCKPLSSSPRWSISQSSSHSPCCSRGAASMVMRIPASFSPLRSRAR